jgi:hypothetical protein
MNLESNVKIAEWLGYKIQKDPTERFFGRLKHPQTNVWYEENELCFDSSWDSLMPVLKKINLLGVDMEQWRMIICPTQYPIENVYAQTVQFIEWYKINK